MKLFEPFNIGTMQLKNRIVVAPMTVDYANADETPSYRHLAYYSERAKGGAGLITLEVVTVDGDHRYQQNSLGLYNDPDCAPQKTGGCDSYPWRQSGAADLPHRSGVFGWFF